MNRAGTAYSVDGWNDFIRRMQSEHVGPWAPGGYYDQVAWDRLRGFADGFVMVAAWISWRGFLAMAAWSEP